MKKVIIASKNPVKINSVQEGFYKMFPDEEFSFEWIEVDSWVGDQPFSDKETLQWAQNRVINCKIKIPDADFWVWIEGWVEKIWDEMQVFAWIYILWNNWQWKAKTSCFYLPKSIIRLLNEGKELWEANDIVFSQINSKQKGGTIWALTNNIITRTQYYIEPVVLALIPFKNSGIYFDNE